MQLLALMAMNALGVYAPSDVGRCCIGLAVNIEPLVLPIGGPSLFDGLCRFGGINVEPNDGQEHGAKADVRLRAFTNVPTPWALDDSDVVQQRVLPNLPNFENVECSAICHHVGQFIK